MTHEKRSELERAVRLLNAGRLDEARRICEKRLASNPADIEALNILGGTLARKGDIPGAIRCASQVCELQPGNAAFLANLGFLYRQAGNFQQALFTMAQAVVADPLNSGALRSFARQAENIEFYTAAPETGVIRDALSQALADEHLDPSVLSTPWHSLLMLDPVFGRLAETDPVDALEPGVLEAALSDPFLLNGLRSLLPANERVERLFTTLRGHFLSNRSDYDAVAFLPFLSALAQHCLLNEHVYACTGEEAHELERLENELANMEPEAAAAAVALLFCYRDHVRDDMKEPLARFASAEAGAKHLAPLLESNVRFADLVSKHVGRIPSFSEDKVPSRVSGAVALQYEENPYPRWRHLETPALSPEHRTKGRGRSILVAGCGTGYETLNLAVHYPEARVVGIDLSRVSLAYGKQKAKEFGIENAEFMHGDILDLDVFDESFDLVTSRGVLHHMEDPVEGWRKLIGRLKPDGLMKIALYSETARESVRRCRDWIRDEGFEANPDGIRAFRQAVFALPGDDPRRDVTNWIDFYSMSMCRDLCFHVQEHNVTLPWIKSTVSELGLAFLTMHIGNPLFRQEYRKRNPLDRAMRDLDRLAAYEDHNPRAFRDMYQFWCCREDSATAKRPPDWFFTQHL